MPGNLKITAVKAQLTHDTETFGKMDPYCVFKIGNQTKKTQVKKDQGKTPVWGEDFNFHIENEETMQLEVWDEDPGSDDLVGSQTIQLKQFCTGNKFDNEWIQIFYNGKSAGKVNLHFQFFADTQNMQEKIQQGAPTLVAAQISIYVVRGQFLKNLDTFGKMDPYCIIKIGQQQFQTKVANSQGKTPVWQERFSAKVTADDIIIFEAWDKDRSSDDLIGSGSYPAIKLLDGQKHFEDVQMFQSGKPAGTVSLEFDIDTSVQSLISVIPGPKENITLVESQMINPSSVFDKKGTISVTCVNARLTHDTELVGKMDPYCVLTYEKTKVKTKVADNQGKTPSWNEKFNIPLGVENKIFLEVYDKDLTKDDLVGTTHLQLHDVTDGRVHEKQFEIFYKNKSAGIVNVIFEFVPQAMNTVDRIQHGLQLLPQGTFQFTMVRGEFLKDLDTFSKMDPYVIVKVGNQQQKTKVAQDQGKTPVWGDKFTFRVTADDTIFFEAFDEDNVKDQEIGVASWPSTKILDGQRHIEWIDVTHKGKPAGRINVEFELVPDRVDVSVPVLVEGPVTGTLSVTATRAILQRDTEWIGNMDPYTVFTLGKQVQKTSVAQEQGKQPSWNEKFIFNLSNEVDLKIEVWDQDPGKDDLVGSTTINLKRFLNSILHSEEFEIFYKGKSAGRIFLQLQFWPVGQPQPQIPQPLPEPIKRVPLPQPPTQIIYKPIFTYTGPNVLPGKLETGPLLNEEESRRIAQMIFQQYDIGGKGRLSPQDLQTMMGDTQRLLQRTSTLSNEDVNCYQRILDNDRDGNVTLRDFENIASRIFLRGINY